MRYCFVRQLLAMCFHRKVTPHGEHTVSQPGGRMDRAWGMDAVPFQVGVIIP